MTSINLAEPQSAFKLWAFRCLEIPLLLALAVVAGSAMHSKEAWVTGSTARLPSEVYHGTYWVVVLLVADCYLHHLSSILHKHSSACNDFAELIMKYFEYLTDISPGCLSIQ